MIKLSKLFTMGLIGAVVMTIPSWQMLTEQQYYIKESNLHEIHFGHVFVNEQKTITALPQKQIPAEERPEVKINSDNTTVQETVQIPELQKTEKMTVTTEPQQATTKPPEHSNPKPTTPDMGDTRVINGQKQVYFLGFKWIEDGNKPNEEIFAKDMYENGNKIGNMGSSTVVDREWQ